MLCTSGLWMTSYFHIMEGIDRIRDDAMFRPVRQVAAFVGRQATLFGRDRQVAAGPKSAVFDCILFKEESHDTLSVIVQSCIFSRAVVRT